MRHHFGYLPDRRWCPSCKDAVLVVDPKMTVDEFPHCGGCGSMITVPLPTPRADPVPTGGSPVTKCSDLTEGRNDD